MSNYQRQILEQKIELLEIQIEEQKKREELLRRERDFMMEQLAQVDEIKQQTIQLQQHKQLLEKTIIETKQRHQEEIFYYNDEVSKLKAQINEKIKDAERVRIESEKRSLKFQEKINLLEKMVESKCARITELQSKLHQSDIKMIRDSDLVASTIRYCETENNMKASNVSTLSRKSQANEYSKMDKNQMKILMGALLKSKKQLEKGNIDLCTDSTKRNKTFYN